MRDVYAAQFLLSSTDALETASDRIAAWCTNRYPGLDHPTAREDFAAALNDTDTVDWTLLQSDATAGRAWTMLYRHADNDDSSLGWRVLAQLTEPSDATRFTIRISQEARETRIRPAQDIPGRPRIVRDLARDLAGIADGRELTGLPMEVRSDDVSALEALLIDPVRRLPVVVTTTSPENARPATDPSYLADQLVGLAHVASIVTSPATYELTARVGKRLSVFDGAVRIYWPGFIANDDPYVHRLWLASTVEILDARSMYRERPSGFARHLLGLIGKVAALRVPSDPLVRLIRREVELRTREAERATWQDLARRSVSIPDDFANEFDAQASRILELELELEIAEEERVRLEGELARIAGNFAYVTAAVAEERGDLGGSTVTPTTIREALGLAASSHPEALVVLPEALESADETRYRHVDKAAAAIRAIGEVAQGWHDNSLGMSFDAAFQERGFDLRLVSPIAQGRYPKDYGRTYDGQRVLLSPHLAIGDGGSTDTIFRVYWYLDELRRRFVVGHAGRHLTDSST